MMISIIIPVHNAVPFLETAIKSVLAQNYRDYELLIVDDHSSDGSFFICTKYAAQDARIKVLSNYGQGVAMARNCGLNHAHGEFVTFIDADDWVDSNYLSVLLARMSPNTLVLSGHYREYGDHKVSEFYVAGGLEVSGCNRLLHQGYVWGKLFDATLIREKNIRFKERMSIHEDHCFFFDYLYECDNVVFCNEMTYHYRRGYPSLSSRHHHWREMYTVSRNLLLRLQRLKNSEATLLGDSAWTDAFYYYGLRQLLSGIDSLYRDKATRVQRRWYLRNLIKKFSEFSDVFKIKIRLCIQILRLLPFDVIDFLFRHGIGRI